MSYQVDRRMDSTLFIRTGNLESEGREVRSNPLYLGSLYVRLDELVGNITLAVSTYCMLTQIDSNFFQVLS